MSERYRQIPIGAVGAGLREPQVHCRVRRVGGGAPLAERSMTPLDAMLIIDTGGVNTTAVLPDSNCFNQGAAVAINKLNGAEITVSGFAGELINEVATNVITGGEDGATYRKAFVNGRSGWYRTS